MLDAYEAACKENLSLDLVMVGGAHSPEYSKEVFKKIKNIQKKNNRIIVVDFVPDDDMPNLYQCASMLLFPSFYEGFGLPVVEAMASGIPVVVSNRGSLPEVAGEAGFFVDPYSVESIKNGIWEVCNCDDIAPRIKIGLNRARTYSWKHSVDTLAKVLMQIK